MVTGNCLASFTRMNDSSVESVRVAWSEPSPPPDATTNPLLFDHPRPVRIHAYPTTSINNRYTLHTYMVFFWKELCWWLCQNARKRIQEWCSIPLETMPRARVVAVA